MRDSAVNLIAQRQTPRRRTLDPSARVPVPGVREEPSHEKVVEEDDE